MMNSCLEKWLFPDKLEIADGSSIFKKDENLKDIVMQIEKALMNDRLRIFKASWKFRIPFIDNFAIIYPWNLLLS